MYFKASCRNNPQTQKVESYYRLVESYRDANNYIRHRTIVTAGFIDHFSADELILFKKTSLIVSMASLFYWFKTPMHIF
ncbi:hypothetical protein FNW52_16545 [Flavobacterium sp. ZT3R18]|uniref:hypothetical protein n=1 Tax=Flavobacterium sp. ZT3R18 TaxID=2594429 RepID=UPI00117B2540|nr:hypothetical protein [Flavobacterium sp. ZT3R18]TRX32761.1 hypothetical protein FNW52_16545 [Flavobacterium sp. ZT3R18]